MAVVTRTEVGSKVKKLSLLSKGDQALVKEFIESLGTLSSRRVEKYEAYVGKIGWEQGKPMQQVTRGDLIGYLNAVNESDFADDTKRDIRLIAKKFFRWLRNDEFVKGIRVGTVDTVINPEDILTDAELDNLRNAARGNIRNEALVEAGYELGCRPHEFLGLRKTDVEFDDYGAKVTIRRGKTGGRTIRVINAGPLLANLIEHHPLRERDAPLWVDNVHGQPHHPLKWTGLKKVLLSLRARARIEKGLTPYVFRHTRATHLAKVLTEPQLCAIFGWKMGSNMPRRYVHFSLRDVDDAILSAHGLKKKELKEVEQPRRCVRCGLLNPAKAEACSKCGMVLTLTAAMAKDEEIERLRRSQAELAKSQKETKDALVNTLVALAKAGTVPKEEIDAITKSVSRLLGSEDRPAGTS